MIHVSEVFDVKNGFLGMKRDICLLLIHKINVISKIKEVIS
jgi:hypothetical protein